MQNLTKQKYFYYIALMLMASTFLPLVFNNLPKGFRSHHLWTIIWGVSLLVSHPRIFFSKQMIYIYSYGLLLLIASQTIWRNMDYWNAKVLFNEFYQIAIGVSVVSYFFQSKDYLGLAKITKWSLIFLFITAIMTLVSAAIDPLYSRNMTSATLITDIYERETILSFKRFGGGGYSTAGAFMCLFPICIYYYKNKKIGNISQKQLIVFFGIIFLGLLGMQIFGNILIAVLGIIIALMGMKKMKQTIFIIGLFLTIIIVTPKKVYINSFLSISGLFKPNSDIGFKLNDMATFIETGASIDNTTAAAGRAERYPMLMETFVKSPLLGCYFLSDEYGNGYNAEGGHLHWMNKLTITGIIGMIIFLLIPYYFIKNSLRYFNSSYKFYYILASFSILCYGLIKVIAGRETWYAFLILLPGLYYLPLLMKPKNAL